MKNPALETWSHQSASASAVTGQGEQLLRNQRLASLGMLTASVAHEIKNPNHVIGLNVSLLEEARTRAINILQDAVDGLRPGESDDVARSEQVLAWKEQIDRSIRMIRDSTFRIEEIVEELKSFARGQVSTVTEPVSLNDVVQSILHLAGDFIRKATSSLSVSLSSNLPKVDANFGKLQQLVLNLVENACQALTDRNQKLSIRTYFAKHPGCVVLQVEDAGRGISAADLPRITEPFFTTRRHEGGTGLGLTVAAEIIRQHSANLVIRSDAGRGTSVTVSFSIPGKAPLLRGASAPAPKPLAQRLVTDPQGSGRC